MKAQMGTVRSDHALPPEKKPEDGTSLASLASIAIGAMTFIGFAVSDPVFDNLLLDIPLYLAVGLADVALFWLTFFLTAIAVGREKALRGERISKVGWGIAAFSFVVAVGTAEAALIYLRQLS